MVYRQRVHLGLSVYTGWITLWDQCNICGGGSDDGLSSDNSEKVVSDNCDSEIKSEC